MTDFAEAIKLIQETAPTPSDRIANIHGVPHFINHEGANPIWPPADHELYLSGLQAIADLANDDAGGSGGLIAVVNETAAELYHEGIEGQVPRRRLAIARHGRDFSTCAAVRRELFHVWLLTHFAPTDELSELVSLISSVSAVSSRNEKDDGVTQAVTVQRGAQVTERALVRPIWRLSPLRTWPEIEQPESPFLLRINQDGDTIACSLRAADGGGWKIEAREKAGEWIKNRTSGVLVLS